MNKGAKFALDGSLAGAVIYALVTILTAWAAILPPIPDEHYATLLAALTAILAAIFHGVRRILVHVGWLPDKPAAEGPPPWPTEAPPPSTVSTQEIRSPLPGA